MKLLADGRRTLTYLKRNGVRKTFLAVCERLGDYRKIKYQYAGPTEKELEDQEKESRGAGNREDAPLFSIVVPTFKTPEGFLCDMMASVLAQTYGKLELLIADATEDEGVERVVRRFSEEDSVRTGKMRVRYLRLKENLQISGNTNQALAEVSGDYIGLLDHDDVLTPDALYEMALRIEEGRKTGREPQMLYSDEDKWDGGNRFYEPHFKPDFNLDLLLSNNYICHFLVIRRELMQKLRLRREYDGAQDYDLVLRASAEILKKKGNIIHIPKVLYHWRCHPGSTSQNPESKKYAYEAGRLALQDFADGMGWDAEAVQKEHMGFYGLDYHPDILAVRRDVGAVGGRLLKKERGLRWRIAAGAMDHNGRVFYEGLPDGFGGYMHRARLLQDVEALDLRCIRLAERCFAIFEKAVGIPYKEAPGEGRFDDSTLPENADPASLGIKLGKALRDAGFLVCWDPGWVRKL